MSLIVEPLVANAQDVTAAANAAAANQPKIEAAGNGVPLVNIVTPNGAGLSHNKYSDFNVGTPGLILNNSNQALQRSQLGGLVQGNPNLRSSGPASVILNEVTSANRSLLQGTTEVHGSAADVIVANPNGLTCNGCGFINTPRVVLSTGTPELDGNGALANLKVTQGDVLIGANGADLSNSAIFDIVSRRISVQGPVKTNGDINLVAGHNSFAYASGTTTALGDDGNEPAIAIDSSALGGMYAGRIKIVSTDKGSGVNMQGNMAANAGTMSLSSDGKLTLGKTYAQKSIQAKSASQSVQVTSTLFSDEAVVLDGKSAVELSDNALVGSSGNVSLNASRVGLGVNALVAAGMTSDGTQTSNGSLNIQADTLQAGNGQLASGSLLSIAAGFVDLSRSTDTGSDTFRSLGTITIDARNISASNGRVVANGKLNLTSSENLALHGGRFVSGEQLLVKAASLTASASLTALKDLTLESTRGDLIQTGDVSGNNAVSVRSARDFTNSGHVLSAGGTNVTAAGGVNNTASGAIASNGDANFTAGGTLANGGEISSLDQMRLKVVGDLTNSGKLLASKNLELSAGGKLSNRQNAAVQGASVTLASGSLDNSGILTTTTGTMSAAVSGPISNAGELSSSGDLTLTTSADLANTGKLVSLGATALEGRSNTAMGAFTNSAGGLINGTTGLNLKAASLSNAGTVGSGSGTLSASLIGNLDNTGLLYGAGASTITTGGTLTNGGEISSRDQMRLNVANALGNSGKLLASKDLTLSVGGDFTNQQSGAIQGANVSLSSASLDNSGILTTSNGTMAATVAGRVNNGGELSAQGDLALATSSDLTNTGKLVSLGAMTLSGANNTASGSISNGAGALINGTTGLNLKAASLSNAGTVGSGSGTLSASLIGNLDNSGLLYGAGASTITAGGTLINGGEISSRDQMRLNVANALGNSGKLLASKDLTLSVGGDFTNQQSGAIQGANVSLSSASLDNSGILTTSNGAMAATVAGRVNNGGELSAQGDLALATSSDLTNTGKLVSLGAMTLSGADNGNLGSFTNSGSGLVNGTRSLTFNAALLNNDGSIGSGLGDLEVNLAGDLNNNGLLYANGNGQFNVDGTFYNSNSDVIADQGINIGGYTRNSAEGLVNSSGLIQSDFGNISVFAQKVINKRAQDIEIYTTSTTDVKGETLRNNKKYWDYRETKTTITNEHAKIESEAGQIRAGGDFYFSGGDLTNSLSLIYAAGNLTINAASAANEGRDLIETTHQKITEKHSIRHRGWGGPRYDRWETNEEKESSRTYDAVYGTIQAGGILSADVSGYLNNDAVRGSAGQIGLSSGDKALGSGSVSGVVGGSAVGVASISNSMTNGSAMGAASIAADQASNASSIGSNPSPTKFSQSVSQQDFTVALNSLAGRRATFETASPNAPYVVETRKQFIDPSKFLGSSYFLSRIGNYNPEKPLKQLGDAYFEYRLIQNQIFTQTGSATLGSETDPVKLVRSLYDNALTERDTLGLATGVALSADQVSKLTQNIVWMEKQTVNGQEVLVPRLYLAKTTADNLNVASAQIKGTAVELAAAGLKNSGAISSDSTLSIASSGAFSNDGGSLFAKSDIVINAADAFSNTSGTISGGNITIQAASISSNTAVTRDVFSNGFGDRAQQTARIEASGNLLMAASGSISSIGGQMSAGNALSLKAGSSVNVAALALETSRDDRFSAGYSRATSNTNTLASLSAGSGLSVTAGQDITLAGATASAGGAAALKAGGNVTITSVADKATSDLSVKSKGGGLFSSSRQFSGSTATSTTRSSSIEAQSGLSVVAGQDVTISGSTLSAAGDKGPANLAIGAGGDLLISSATDTVSKQSASSSRRFMSSKSQSGTSYDETNIASALYASGNISLSAGQDAAISGSNVTAGNGLSIVADNVSVIGAQESHSSRSTSSKSGLFVGSGDGFASLYGSKKSNNAQAETNNIASNVSAGRDVALSATGTDVNILGSNISAGNDLALSAARDVNITPGAESSSSSSETKRSGFGISVSSTSGGFSVGVGVKKTTDATSQAANTNATSSLAAGRDLTISAGRDINLQGVNASSERDLSLAALRDVNLLAATDSSNYAHMHEELFAGVSLNVESKLISAGKGLASAASGLGGSNSAYALAPTALAAKQAYQVIDQSKILDPAPIKASSLGSASITAGFTYQKTNQTAATTTPVVTQLRSGGSTAIVAQEGSITGHGAQIVAGYDANGQLSKDADGGNILLSAGKDITLSSVQSTSMANSTSTSASAAIGVDLGTSTPVGNAAFGKGKVNNEASGQANTHVSGTGTVALNAGNDATLKGAVVSGTSVIANVGHDLTIESVQDTATYRESSVSVGGSFGTNGASARATKGNTKGDYANVSEQSGIVAGSGGYHIAVGNGVDLKAGVITSTADKDKNSLTADHLTYSDLDNISQSSTSTVGVGIGMGADGKLGLPTPIAGQPAKEEDHGKALATLSPGNLMLANQTQDLASLNTDASRANAQVSPLDIEKLKAKQQSAEALSQLLNEGVGDLALKLNLPPDSPIRTVLHGFAGAAVSAAAGSNIGTGALSGVLSELANVALQDVLKANPNLSEADKAAITQWVATAVGAAVGGQEGAATALDNVNHNYLKHKEREEFTRALAACAGGEKSACQRADELRNISDNRDKQLDSCVGNSSSACVKARADLRIAAAEYLDAALNGTGENDDFLSLQERHMVFLQAWQYANDNDAKDSDELTSALAGLKSDAAKALLTGSKEEVAKIIRDPIIVGVIAFGGQGNAKTTLGEGATTGKTVGKVSEEAGAGVKTGLPVGESYIPGSNSIVKDTTVRLDQNIVTASGEIIPAGSVVTESGGAFKIVTPNGVTVTGRTSDMLKPNSLVDMSSKALTDGEKIGILREAANLPSGNRTLSGAATRAEADELGQAWVGPGYKVASDGRTLVSEDGTRTFRPATPKPNSKFSQTGVQVNFETRDLINGRWNVRSNAHLDVID